LADMNPALSAALEAQVLQCKALDRPLIERLYARHIQNRHGPDTEPLQDELRELIGQLGALVARSSEGVAEFASTLDSCEQALGSINDPASLQRLIHTLVTATATVHATTTAVNADFQASQTALIGLREQLGTLRGEALTDPLTGLRNRRGFDQDVAALYAKESEALASAAILLADLDHFKRVNDTYGHAFGDQVIRACAQVISGAIKGRDVASRFGGEEFLILLPDTSGAGAMAVAEQIRTTFSKARIRRSGSEEAMGQVTISIGIAVPSLDEPLDQVIARADTALYQAKREGRNTARLALEDSPVRKAAG
jgi:diguanylate cyclase